MRLHLLLLGALRLSVVGATQTQAVPRPFGERSRGRVIVGRNPASARRLKAYMVGTFAQGVLQYFIDSEDACFRHVADRQSAIHHCRHEFGVPLLPAARPAQRVGG